MAETPKENPNADETEAEDPLERFQSGDPLAELAKLVSQDNPFTAFEDTDQNPIEADLPPAAGRLFTGPVEAEPDAENEEPVLEFPRAFRGGTEGLAQEVTPTAEPETSIDESLAAAEDEIEPEPEAVVEDIDPVLSEPLEAIEAEADAETPPADSADLPSSSDFDDLPEETLEAASPDDTSHYSQIVDAAPNSASGTVAEEVTSFESQLEDLVDGSLGDEEPGAPESSTETSQYAGPAIVDYFEEAPDDSPAERAASPMFGSFSPPEFKSPTLSEPVLDATLPADFEDTLAASATVDVDDGSATPVPPSLGDTQFGLEQAAAPASDERTQGLPDFDALQSVLEGLNPTSNDAAIAPANTAYDAAELKKGTLEIPAVDPAPTKDLVDWESEIAAALAPEIQPSEPAVEADNPEPFAGIEAGTEDQIEPDPFDAFQTALNEEVDQATRAAEAEPEGKAGGGLLAGLGLGALFGSRKQYDEDLDDQQFEQVSADIANELADDEDKDFEPLASAADEGDFDEAESETRDSRGKLIAATLLGLVVLGGSGAFLYGNLTNESTDPDKVPTISAQTEPIKVKPDDAGGAEIPNQDSAVFDTTTGDAASDDNVNIVPRQEEVAALPEVGTTESPRVIVPRAVTPNSNPNEPRRVRTLIVNPDGSIVRAPEAGEATGDAPAETVPTVAAPEAPAPADSVPVTPQPESTASVQPDADATTATEEPSAGEQAGDPSIPLPIARPTVSFTPPSAQQPRAATPAPQPVASNAPRNIAPPAATQSTAGGPFVVQLASRRSQEQALSTYASLQNRYPGILGSYSPIIERADLGSRGVFYRLRVGPLGSQGAATNLCNQLRGAGLSDCLVQRN